MKINYANDFNKGIYFLATPIGNLGDITLRGLSALNICDQIICEDKRRLKKLLNYFEIKYNDKNIILWNETKDDKQKKIDFLKKDKFIKTFKDKITVFLSDNGTPLFSDPGHAFIRFIYDNQIDIKLSPLPGPNSVASFVSITGINKFKFLNFISKKNPYDNLSDELKRNNSIIFFESPHRFSKLKDVLKDLLSEYNLKIFIGRELTKRYEEVVYLNSDLHTKKEIKTKLESIESKGEFVIGIEKIN
ncbi:MAG: SAM-dependent methyltransferase [archaeon]